MKKQIRKQIYLLLLSAVLVATVLSGCSSSQETAPDGTKALIEPATLCQEIIDSGAFADELNLIDNSYSDMIIGISGDTFTSAVIYTGSGATAEELAIIEVASDSDANYITAKLSTHISNQSDAYAGYKPEEVDKINNAVIKQSGTYILLCVADNYDAALEIIDKYFD